MYTQIYVHKHECYTTILKINDYTAAQVWKNSDCHDGRGIFWKN